MRFSRISLGITALMMGLAVVALLWGGAREARAQLVMPAPKLAVSGYIGDTMTLVDARTVRIDRTFSVGQYPQDMAVSPDKKFLVVTQPKKNSLTVVNLPDYNYGAAINSPVLDDVYSPVFSPDGARLYLLNARQSLLIEMHVPTFNVIRTLPLNFFGPKHLVISPDGTRAYISHPEVGEVTVVDLPAWQFVEDHRLGGTVGGLDVSPNGKKLVVVLPQDNTVCIYDLLNNFKLVESVPVGQGADAVKISVRNQCVVLNTISNDVTIFNMGHTAGRFLTAVGAGPAALTFSPDGLGCYVGNYGSNDMSVIDMKTGRQLGRLMVGKGPRGIVWIP